MSSTQLKPSMVVPFGKYKGQPVEVLAQDKNYTDWLLTQPAFKQKNPELVSIIINNFQEPSETPEHNALQVKFLSEEYRLKFVVIAKPDILQTRIDLALDDYLRRKKESTLFDIEASVGAHSCYCTHIETREREDKAKEILSEKIPSINDELSEIKSNFAKVLHNFTLSTSGFVLESKSGCDIEFYTEVSFNDKQQTLIPKSIINDVESSKEDFGSWFEKESRDSYLNKDDCFTSIEIKPSVGDDFPAVLRQMKLSGAKYLFLEGYRGISATKQEFCNYFESQGKTVVFKQDVDAVDLSKYLGLTKPE